MSLRKALTFVFCSLLLINFAYADHVLHDTQGNQIQLKNLKNKWIIVNYWASWCPSCMEEVPELNRFYQNNHKDVLIYGVNYDRLPRQSLIRAVSRTNIEFPVLVEDPSRVLQLNSVVYLPTTFILNPEGKVVKKIVGPSTERSLLATISKLQRQTNV